MSDQTFEEYQRDIGDWAVKTFDSRRPRDSILGLGPANHVLKEVRDELIPAINSQDFNNIMEEAADCFNILCHIAHIYGFSLLEAGRLKYHHVRTTYVWGEPDADGVIEHVKVKL